MVPCPECSSYEVYCYERNIAANSNTIKGGGPNLLPGLGSNWLFNAQFLPVVCKNCGLVRFYASEEAREKLESSGHWELIDQASWPDESV